MKSIKISKANIDKITRETVVEFIKQTTNMSDEDSLLFNINALSEQQINSMIVDLRTLIACQGCGSLLMEDGNLFKKDNCDVTLPLKSVKKELYKLGIEPWQIKTTSFAHNIRIIILYVDVYQNTKVIVNTMDACGWMKADVSEPFLRNKIPFRTISFDPKVQEPVTTETRQYTYLYHLTPSIRAKSILSRGLEPRNENTFLTYTPRVYLLKGDTPKKEIEMFGWRIFNKNKRVKNGNYTLIRIDLAKVPNTVHFYHDPRYDYGYFTIDTIPPQALSIYGTITYDNKYCYNDEQLQVVAQDSTLTN